VLYLTLRALTWTLALFRRRSMTARRRRTLVPAVSAAAGLALLAGCSGSVAGAGGGGDATGFDYGAGQEDVDAAIADLDPVTLTIQPYAASPDAAAAIAEQSFMDAVEERSGGKITFDIAWGQSIASYPEVDDALADGRLDLAYSVPIYSPAEYPLVDAYNKLSHYTSSAPLTGEAITQAQMSEAAWNDDAVLAEYEENGVTPLNPLVSSGNYWAACNAPGSEAEDWKGRQIRIGGSAQTPISENLGASPVSMEYGEVFEALHRRLHLHPGHGRGLHRAHGGRAARVDAGRGPLHGCRDRRPRRGLVVRDPAAAVPADPLRRREHRLVPRSGLRRRGLQRGCGDRRPRGRRRVLGHVR
jgi:TRAP-type C4-dicarboxylate transport system substrate-binding protein